MYNGVLFQKRGVVWRLVEFLQVQMSKPGTFLANFLHQVGQVQTLESLNDYNICTLSGEDENHLD